MNNFLLKVVPPFHIPLPQDLAAPYAAAHETCVLNSCQNIISQNDPGDKYFSLSTLYFNM